uniref:Uncharacterized protein n=1 Tax=Glossina austeni TaxID=7395 RepID=A0A1A9VS91_GLOAU
MFFETILTRSKISVIRIKIYTYLLGSRRGSGCNQAANLAPDEPGAPLIKSFKNCRSLDCELKRVVPFFSDSYKIMLYDDWVLQYHCLETVWWQKWKIWRSNSKYGGSTKPGALNAHEKLMYSFLIKLNSNPKSLFAYCYKKKTKSIPAKYEE